MITFESIFYWKRKQVFPYIVLGTLLCFSGCRYLETEEEEEQVVASVGDYQLTMDEINEVVPNNTSAADSVVLAKTYIDSWIKDHVVILSAENFLSDEQKNFDKELESYHNSLLVYAYEKAFLKQNLDTLVSEDDINAYYKKNEAYFILKENIVKVNYFILPDSLTNIKTFEKLFYADKLEKSTELEQYCVDNNANYYFGEHQWIYVSDLKEKIPLDQHQEKSLYKKNNSVVFKKDGKLFFLKILDYDLKGKNSPLSLQADKIKAIIINQRRKATLNKLHQDIFLQAKDNNLIKEYEQN